MRDRYDAELWNQHHDQFSEWLHGAIAGTVTALRRRSSHISAPVPQLLAATVAVSLAVLTFAASVG